MREIFCSMSNNTKQQQISELAEQLALRSALQNITNRIHAAQNLKQILVDLKDGILSLFNAYSVTIYVADPVRNEIYSMLLAGTKINEIRLPINKRSIAGYVASTQQCINVADAYDRHEIKTIDQDLVFDESWDRKTGFRTAQVLAVPIMHEGSLKGVVQILNRKGGGRFSPEERIFLEEIADVLGIAFYNQQRIGRRRKTRFDYLIARGFLKETELDSSWEESRKSDEQMETYLVRKFKIPKEDVCQSLEDFYKCKYILFSDKIAAPEELCRNLRPEYLRRELWVPFEKSGDLIRVIVDDPNNILKRDMIENILKTKKIEYNVSSKDEILKFINSFYRIEGSQISISDILGKLEITEHTDEEEEENVSDSDSAVMQLVNKIINDGHLRRASDIHIEPSPKKKSVDVRFRIDGDCIRYQTFPYNYRAAVVSRIKIMANLDITERRLPQDGKIRFKRGGGDEIELRIATIPTQGNVEDVVMRILAKGETMGLEDMAMSPENYKALVSMLEKPYGIILCVGPTGSGKTTTLHAALHHINTPDTKFWRAEDPVEITQEGLRQVQVNPKIGFDFSHAMRAFLRADPDVIMVGEMRDFETAKIGVEASLTGHLVFSTLHTNNAPETVVRLLDMGIDPFNFADSLLGVLAQRLIRTLCKKCKEAYHPTQEEYDHLADFYGSDLFPEINVPYNEKFTLYRPKGCMECNNTGYKGRMGLHELVVNSDEIKRLIAKREPVEAIRQVAAQQGMRTLLQDGIQKVIKGLTDFKQVLAVCIK
jgi:type II secretory ATPase GspE/PulE/Tfp pilus assembly ATPase PilB-like protein